jgi:hypothetical protein
MASPLRARARDTIVFGGLTAGTLDIADAFVVAWLNGGTAVRVLHAIASGVVGRAASDGGARSAATAFYLGSLKLPFLLRRPLLWGPVFGLGVWAVMYQIVLPMTFGRPFTMPPLPNLLNQLGIHALGVGLPIALWASRSARRTTTS